MGKKRSFNAAEGLFNFMESSHETETNEVTHENERIEESKELKMDSSQNSEEIKPEQKDEVELEKEPKIRLQDESPEEGTNLKREPVQAETDVKSNAFEKELNSEQEVELIKKDSNSVIAGVSEDKAEVSLNITKEEIIQCSFSLTKTNAFFIQKTALQRNANIDVTMASIISEWLSEGISISDEEAINIIDASAKERSGYIRRTYKIPVKVRDAFGLKAAELGFKRTVMINHIIHDTATKVE